MSVGICMSWGGPTDKKLADAQKSRAFIRGTRRG